MNRSVLTNPYVLIIPGFILSAFIILWPLYQIGLVSVSHVNGVGVLQGFAGVDNYIEVFTDQYFLGVLGRTFLWTFGIVAGTILVALPVALILNEDFYGRSLARVIVMLPWAVALPMMAIIWRWALNGNIGMLNSALHGIGLINNNIQWLAQGPTAFAMEILVGILVTIPFATTIFLGGLSSIPLDLYEAAQLEGANRWQTFREITFPLLRPFINIAVVLNVIYVFNSFPIIWVMTEGDPANSTDILVTYLYKLAFRNGELGEASALSIMMFVLLLFFTVIYVYTAMKEERA
jgi:multiple sugar transport system permease protein